MTPREWQKFAIVELITSVLTAIGLGLCIFAGWVAPIWAFIAPFALFAPFAIYALVGIFRTAAADREREARETEAGPRARTT